MATHHSGSSGAKQAGQASPSRIGHDLFPGVRTGEEDRGALNDAHLLEVERFDGIPTFRVRTATSKLFYYSTKRIIDIVLSLGILIGLSPLLILISLLIKLTSKGKSIR